MKFKLLLAVSAIILSSVSFSQTPRTSNVSTRLKPLTAPMPVSGSFYKIRNTASGRYLQPLNASLENGATIHLADNRNDDHYQWKAILTNDGHYKFQNKKSGKFLAVMGASKEVYGILCQWDDAGQPDILWKPEKNGNGFKLRNKNSSLFAAVEGGSKANNAKIIQWNDDGAADKIFSFEIVAAPKAPEKMPQKESVWDGKLVLFDVLLNSIGVSEGTRNRVDNGDCKRVFGAVETELWEMDDRNKKVRRIDPYNNTSYLIFLQEDYKTPAPVAYSFHQERGSTVEMGKVTYNIPEELLKQKKLMLIVRTNLGTRHKDNDFATYDALRMAKKKESSFILDGSILTGQIDKTIQVNTDPTASNRTMHVQDFVIPFAVFNRTDDTHNIWLNMTVTKK